MYNMQVKYFITFTIPTYAYFCRITKRKTRQRVRMFINCFPFTVDFWVRKNPCNALLAIMGTYAYDRRMEARASHIHDSTINRYIIYRRRTE